MSVNYPGLLNAAVRTILTFHCFLKPSERYARSVANKFIASSSLIFASNLPPEEQRPNRPVTLAVTL